ncbi:hypothetical protein RM704_41190 [Streptomyces sp. DSM 3412]|uniref:Glycosyl hydrolase n=1 Tax=Streptomyces gottesmaniae TaxID=3075518 RepID=A0ABU2ZB09_9ACTN|nr:hypothetical protein [Streptomyces sp. DSM 3412]MDT0573791.1 hypothetical protein [Streptomyces sp. DSM 3412]
MAAAEIQRVWKPSVTERWAGRRPLWWTVGPTGELAVLLVHRQYLRRSRYVKGWVGWRPQVPFDAVLVMRQADGSLRRRTIKDVPVSPSHIGLLPESRLLLASGRAGKEESGAWSPNAVVFSLESGDQEAAFCIGDDIPALVTDRGGSIWTAYGDEGIYGGHPESVAGLAGWSAGGQAIWAPRGRLPDWPLEGCTAATEGDRVWLVWYSGSRRGGTFLTRITPSTGEVTSWPSPVRDPDGFAVHGRRAVLTKRVHNQRSTEVVRAELDGGAWRVTERHRMRVPGRVVLRCGQGRDGFLWLRAGDMWLRIAATPTEA